MIFDNLSCYLTVAKIPNITKKLLAHEWASLLLSLFEKQHLDDKPRKCLNLVLNEIVNPNTTTTEQFVNAAISLYSIGTKSYIDQKIQLSASIFTVADICFASSEKDSKFKLIAALCRTAYKLAHTNNFNWQYITESVNHCYHTDLVFDVNWRTSTVIELTKTIFNNNSLDICPILADALEESGCNETKILERLRSGNSLRSDWLFWNLLGLDG
jgi:hypothetical protein